MAKITSLVQSLLKPLPRFIPGMFRVRTRGNVPTWFQAWTFKLSCHLVFMWLVQSRIHLKGFCARISGLYGWVFCWYNQYTSTDLITVLIGCVPTIADYQVRWTEFWHRPQAPHQPITRFAAFHQSRGHSCPVIIEKWKAVSFEIWSLQKMRALSLLNGKSKFGVR